jgi:hypothetical protein
MLDWFGSLTALQWYGLPAPLGLAARLHGRQRCLNCTQCCGVRLDLGICELHRTPP